MNERRMVRTAGIDLAAQPARTASCVLAWMAAGFWIEELVPAGSTINRSPGRSSATTSRWWASTSAGVAGRLCPRGSGHHEGSWPFVQHGRNELASPLRHRRTDRVLMEQVPGARPLSAALDPLAASVVRAAHVLARCGEEGSAVDRSGLTGPVAEVYPAASARIWDLTWVLQRSRRGEPDRERLRRVGPAFAESLSQAGLVGGAEALHGDAMSLHGMDALLAALSARAVLGGATRQPTREEHDLASREGWLHWPTCPLDALQALPYSRRT